MSESKMRRDSITRSEAKEIAREIAREEFKMMSAEIRETMREVMDEKLGKTYEEEREFLHRWIKKTDQFSSGFWGKAGAGVLFLVFAGIGAIVIAKLGLVATKL